MRVAGSVERYHTWPTTTRQTVADHTWHVLRIYIQLFGAPDPDVTCAIMFHDAPAELKTGDLPFPIKSANPTLKAEIDKLESEYLESMGISTPDLTEEEWASIKICDLLEMHEYAYHEICMGNKYAEPVYSDTLTAVYSIIDGLDREGLPTVTLRSRIREFRETI